LPNVGGHFECDRLEGKRLRTAISKPYIILYRYTDTTLTVYRIIHERFNIDELTLIDLDENQDE